MYVLIFLIVIKSKYDEVVYDQPSDDTDKAIHNIVKNIIYPATPKAVHYHILPSGREDQWTSTLYALSRSMDLSQTLRKHYYIDASNKLDQGVCT